MPVEYCEHDWPMNSNCPHCELVQLRIDAAKCINLSRFRQGPLADADWVKYDGHEILAISTSLMWSIFVVRKEDYRLHHNGSFTSISDRHIRFWFPLSEVPCE